MNSPEKICFVVVGKDHHTQNIGKLEKLYRERFPDRYYLAPFYQGDLPEVIPGYHSTFSIQGNLADAYHRISSGNFTHYIFCAADLLLNPGLNAGNIIVNLNLAPETAYFKSITSVVEGISNGWHHAIAGIAAFHGNCYKAGYVQHDQLLPSRETAAQLINRHGISWHPVTQEILNRYYQMPRHFCIDQFVTRFVEHIRTHGPEYSYPLVYGFADLVIVPAESLKLFCYYCGVFAGMRLFSEIAIPTALAFSCATIIQEKQTAWQGNELWDYQSIQDLKVSFGQRLPGLLESFKERQLYLRPINITEWEF